MPVNIRITKDGKVPLRQQIAAQIEYLIATGKLKPGEPLPSVRTLARQLQIHHNTVSRAYKDVAAVHLLSSKHGSRLVVRTPEERASPLPPDLDDLINQTIRLAGQHGYSVQKLSARVRERLIEEPPDHVLALSFDAGMRRLLKSELEQALLCQVAVCSPRELVANPGLALGALVVSPPGVMRTITKVLPKDRPPIPILYSSAEPHLALVRKLTRPSIVAVASVSEHFLMVARGLLCPIIKTQHTLVDCLVAEDEIGRIPTADILFCDVIVSARLNSRKTRPRNIRYPLIAQECLNEVASAMPVSGRSAG